MLTKFAAKTTDRTRRAALELAIQLPEDVTEARAVLDQAGDLLEGFLIRAPREIWNRSAAPDCRGALVSHRRALLWTLCAWLALAPVAAGFAQAFGAEIVSGLVLAIGLAATALVFGQIYGVIFAVLAVVGHNLLTAPPLYGFSAPAAAEIIRGVGFLVLAILLPPLANAAPFLRGLALRGAAPGCAAAARSPSPDHAAAPSLCPDR